MEAGQGKQPCSTSTWPLAAAGALSRCCGWFAVSPLLSARRLRNWWRRRDARRPRDAFRGTSLFVVVRMRSSRSGAHASVFGEIGARAPNFGLLVAGLAIIAMGLHFLGLSGWSFCIARGSAWRSHRLGYLMGLALRLRCTPCIGPTSCTLGSAGRHSGTCATPPPSSSRTWQLPFIIAALADGPVPCFMSASVKISGR